MPVSEKTYTFRAPADLGPRMREAFLACRKRFEARDLDDDDLAAVMERFWASFLRRAQWEQVDNQSALLRATCELFVAATEKVAQDREYVELYREWASEDAEASAVRAGALHASARRWRDR